VSLAPKKYYNWSNLGDAYRWIPDADTKATHAYSEAIALATAELHLNPSDSTIRARQAECLAKLGRHDEAKAEVARALAADPTNVDTMYRAAVIANANGDTSSALTWLSRAIAKGYQKAEIERDPEFALLR